MSKSTVIKMRWGVSEQSLLDMIEYINKRSLTKNLRLVEIGTYTGESTAIFCQHFKRVLTIDPFLENYDPVDRASYSSMSTEIYDQFCARMVSYNNYSLIKQKSDQAILEIMNKPVVQCFDVVYIDGLHQYEQVKKDIINYRAVINKGGFITGHDYCDGWQEVKKAVNEIFGEPDIVFTDGSWVVRNNA